MYDDKLRTALSYCMYALSIQKPSVNEILADTQILALITKLKELIAITPN
jgi:hypothetical protein